MPSLNSGCEKTEHEIHAQNVRACSALLKRLFEFHPVATPPEPVVVIAEPVKVEPQFLPPPVDPKWIKFIEEIPGPRDPSVKEIKLCVCQHFQVSPRDLESPRRLHKFVVPRQVAFYLARKLTSRSYPDIGRKFGGRDHTTILHGSKVVERRMEADAQFAATVRALEEQLQ